LPLGLILSGHVNLCLGTIGLRLKLDTQRRHTVVYANNLLEVRIKEALVWNSILNSHPQLTVLLQCSLAYDGMPILAFDISNSYIRPRPIISVLRYTWHIKLKFHPALTGCSYGLHSMAPPTVPITTESCNSAASIPRFHQVLSHETSGSSYSLNNLFCLQVDRQLRGR